MKSLVYTRGMFVGVDIKFGVNGLGVVKLGGAKLGLSVEADGIGVDKCCGVGNGRGC